MYTYDENGNLIEKSDGSVTTTYAYDIENRLTAVREGGAVLMAATYDGDGNRTFQLTRQTRTVEITEDSFLDGLFSSNVSGSPTNTVASIPEIFGVSQEEVYTYLEQIFVDPADTIFWYGVIQGFIEFFVGANTFLTAICTDWFNGEWTAVTDAYELELHSDVVYSDTDMETLQNAGLSEEEIAYITTGKSSSREDIVIPSKTSSNIQATYDLTYYVNDVNTANTQVLMTNGASESQEASYIYGLERIAEVEAEPVDVEVNTESDEEQDNTDVLSASAEYYIYDGRGSVVQTITGGEITQSLTYDPFGEITSGADENFIGYAYNGEETNAVTGLQYLRARYYDAELGSFITIDSYLGSLTDTISQNRYTYANNDPVNNIDPSGHYSQNVNGTNKYYQSTGLNELRDYMTAAALWAGKVSAQSGYNSAVSRAQNTACTNYQNISGISQSTANSYIAQGIAQAEQVSMNYGCSEPAVPNEAVAKFTNNVNAGRVSANAQIEGIKESKKVEHDLYMEELYEKFNVAKDRFKEASNDLVSIVQGIATKLKEHDKNRKVGIDEIEWFGVSFSEKASLLENIESIFNINGYVKLTYSETQTEYETYGSEDAVFNGYAYLETINAEPFLGAGFDLLKVLGFEVYMSEDIGGISGIVHIGGTDVYLNSEIDIYDDTSVSIGMVTKLEEGKEVDRNIELSADNDYLIYATTVIFETLIIKEYSEEMIYPTPHPNPYNPNDYIYEPQYSY